MSRVKIKNGLIQQSKVKIRQHINHKNKSNSPEYEFIKNLESNSRKCRQCGEALSMYATTVCRQCGDK